jgi:hypothetical protein
MSRGPLDERRESILKTRTGHLAIVLPALVDEDARACYERLPHHGRTCTGLAT